MAPREGALSDMDKHDGVVLGMTGIQKECEETFDSTEYANRKK